ncbi:MAG: AMP-binding protein [Magnetococcus sp. DMHC-6]
MFAKKYLRPFLSWLFKIPLRNFYSLSETQQGILIVANKNTSLDWFLLYLALPDNTLFAYDSSFPPPPWWRWWHPTPQAINIQKGDMDELAPLLQHLRQAGVVALFPEVSPLLAGGTIGKMSDWSALLLTQAGVPILPVHLHRRGSCKFWPRIRIHFFPTRPFLLDANASQTNQRQQATYFLGDCLAWARLLAVPKPQTLWEGLRWAQKRVAHNRFAIPIQDSLGQHATHAQLVFRARVLAHLLDKKVDIGERVGIVLPTSVGAVITFFALQALGCVPALLNFSVGSKPMVAAAQLAGLKIILTSRLFVRKAHLEAAIAALEAIVTIIYLEDIKKELTTGKAIAVYLSGLLPNRWIQKRQAAVRPDDPAVILFTSGSEGTPKGVLLSHANLITNGVQVAARIELRRDDLFFNVLPMFHSFGLTVGALMPLLHGMRLLLHPSPLDYREIPQLALQHRATILAGTNTFLAGYGRTAHPFDFHTLRLVFAGAEPLRPTTRQLWLEKFGLRILEGYGCTETSPALAVNTPLENRPGSMGRLLPGIKHLLTPVTGIHNAGALEVTGPNIMLGYLSPKTIGAVMTPQGERGLGWYPTGDIVRIDTDGFLFMVGRSKRFAKIAGEMVSLAAVEALVEELWSDDRHAVLTVPDPRKNERLILLTEKQNPDRTQLTTMAQQKGLGEIYLPKTILTVEKIPLLGNGKIDYNAALELAHAIEI